MPVKISDDLGGSEEAINAAEYSVGRINFNLHYSVYENPLQSITELGNQENMARWDDLASAIAAYQMANPAVEEGNIAMQFIHCYDVADNKLYQRLRLCAMLPEQEGQQDLVPPDMWFKIAGGSVTPTRNSFPYDAPYMENVGYRHDPDATELEQLINYPDKFVRSVTYPWLSEIKQMYLNNGSPEGADIKIAAFTRTPESPAATNVQFPHGFVLFLSVNGEDLLNNENYISIFTYKGADNGTLCPPMCGVYVPPSNPPSAP